MAKAYGKIKFWYRLINHDGEGEHRMTKRLSEAVAWQEKGGKVQTRERMYPPYSMSFWRGRWWDIRKKLEIPTYTIREFPEHKAGPCPCKEE